MVFDNQNNLNILDSNDVQNGNNVHSNYSNHSSHSGLFAIREIVKDLILLEDLFDKLHQNKNSLEDAFPHP